MRNSQRSTLLATVLVVALPTLAHAHPGHEGHELTWDFSHLAAHPLATLGCAAVFGAGVWLAWRLARPSPSEIETRHQR